jgi:hypothetical protein
MRIRENPARTTAVRCVRAGRGDRPAAVARMDVPDVLAMSVKARANGQAGMRLRTDDDGPCGGCGCSPTKERRPSGRDADGVRPFTPAPIARAGLRPLLQGAAVRTPGRRGVMIAAWVPMRIPFDGHEADWSTLRVYRPDGGRRGFCLVFDWIRRIMLLRPVHVGAHGRADGLFRGPPRMCARSHVSWIARV